MEYPTIINPYDAPETKYIKSEEPGDYADSDEISKNEGYNHYSEYEQGEALENGKREEQK